MRILALALGLLLACTPVTVDRQDVERELADADWQGAEDALRKGLDRHPDDVLLLLAGAKLYLQPELPEFYRPRLALHYAMRADRAASGGNAEVARMLFAAWRANGRPDELDALVRKGLSAVRHPDAAEPIGLPAVDPDLLEPTIRNLQEEARRRRGERREPCGDSLVTVPSGSYPTESGHLQIEGFCFDAGTSVHDCAARSLRVCTDPERKVACGPLRATLVVPSSCDAPSLTPCCRDSLPVLLPLH